MEIESLKEYIGKILEIIKQFICRLLWAALILASTGCSAFMTA